MYVSYSALSVGSVLLLMIDFLSLYFNCVCRNDDVDFHKMLSLQVVLCYTQQRYENSSECKYINW